MKLRAKKSFGQHFLHSPSVIKKIIAAAEIQPQESVLEIGPGRGVLTEALVEAGALVTAVEADKDLIVDLQKMFEGKAEIIFSDILKVDLKKIGLGNYKLVANLPYNITSAVLEKFLTADPAPSRMVLMIQKEVADRIMAKPGEMSLLSVVCQLYAKVQRVVNVPPGAFRPMPKVDSAVVVFERKFEVCNVEREASLQACSSGTFHVSRYTFNESIICLAKAGFSSRRKQLHRNLAEAHIASTQAIKSALQAIGLKETARAQELKVEEWIDLYRILYNLL